MSVSVIDEFVVTLGLDSTEFTVGQEKIREEIQETTDTVKAAEKEMQGAGAQSTKEAKKQAADEEKTQKRQARETETARKKDVADRKKVHAERQKQAKQQDESARKSTLQFRDMAMQLAGLFGVAVTAQKLVSFFGELNAGNAGLSRFSRNAGAGVHEINTWGQAVELAGGSAQDAQADISALSQSITNLKATGDVSPLLLLFQRMNISLRDSKGELRGFAELYGELGDRLRQFSRPDAFNLGRGAGLSESTLNVLLMEKSARQQLLALAEQSNKLTEDSARRAEALQGQWRKMGQQAKAFGQSILEDITPAVSRLFTLIGSIGRLFDKVANSSAGKFLNVALHPIKELLALPALGKLGTLIDKLAGPAIPSPDSGPPLSAAAPPAGAIDTRTRGLRNNNPGNIRAVGNQPRDDKGFRIFPTQAEGIAAADAQLDRYDKRGINTIHSITNTWAPPGENDTGAYAAHLVKATGRGLHDRLTPADRQRLLQAMFAHESGAGSVSANAIAGALRGQPGALAAARGAVPTPGATRNTGSGASGGSTTTVQIDKIEVNTAATDANGIAADMRGALQRKGIVAQADYGMTS